MGIKNGKASWKVGVWGPQKALSGGQGVKLNFLTKIKRKNCIKQPCIFQFCQFLTWCKTITFWFERTVLCFGADIFLFQRKSADLLPIPMPDVYIAIIATSKITWTNFYSHKWTSQKTVKPMWKGQGGEGEQQICWPTQRHMLYTKHHALHKCIPFNKKRGLGLQRKHIQGSHQENVKIPES